MGRADLSSRGTLKERWINGSRTSLLKVWFADQEYGSYVGTCQKCSVSGPTPTLKQFKKPGDSYSHSHLRSVNRKYKRQSGGGVVSHFLLIIPATLRHERDQSPCVCLYRSGTAQGAWLRMGLTCTPKDGMRSSYPACQGMGTGTVTTQKVYCSNLRKSPVA